MLENKNIVPFQVSKWIKIPMLVDADEMGDLIKQVPPFKVYDVQRVTRSHEGIYEARDFLEKYGAYIESLKKGEIPAAVDFRALFSSVWSVTGDAIYALPAQDGRRLLKTSRPAVQLQMNEIRYAAEEKIFRSQVFSSESITWGLQMGFPHLYLDPETFEMGKTRLFPNMALFTAIQRWIRSATVATPFLVNGERIISSIRLGKRCFSWIGSHPQLQSCGIEVDRRY